MNEKTEELVLAFVGKMMAGEGLIHGGIPFPYDPLPKIKSVQWANPLASAMIEDELGELTNQLNYWRACLQRWKVWNELLQKEESADVRWDMEFDWVEPIAYFCMLQPSTTYDRFTLVATNALHQISMTLNPGDVDELLGDPTPERTRFFPTRKQKEKQLKIFSRKWITGNYLINELGGLDNKEYQEKTRDYRNKANHGIAPRFSVGITNMVTRYRQPAMNHQRQPDGSYKPVPIPGKFTTAYGLGGINPLSMESAWEMNYGQFQCAAKIFKAYLALLAEAVAVLPCKTNG